MNSIIDYLRAERQQFIPIVSDFMKEQLNLHGDLTPEYNELLRSLGEYLVRGGKWHRPALTLISYQLAGGNNLNAARQAAVSLEVLHRYLLIHDDVIDRDLMRHGGPTIEKVYQDRFAAKYPHKDDAIYSKANAIVAGDLVKSLAYKLLLEADFSKDIQVSCIEAYVQLMIETAAGWQLQNEQNYQSITDVTEDDFFRGMQLVSCQYSIMWPLRLGQILAGKLTKDSWDINLDHYGWHTGALFQISDDIIGMFGDEKETGKPVGHDYREGKKTFLVLIAYKKASAADKEFLLRTLGTDVTTEEVDQARRIIVDTGALADVKKMAEDHLNEAKKYLALISSQSPEGFALLDDLLDFLLNRTY